MRPIAFVACLFLALTTAAGQASAEPLTLKWAWAVAPTQHMSIEAGKAAKAIEEASKGEIKVLTYPAGQLYKDKDLLDAVQNGSIDMTFFGFSFWAGQLPAVGIMQVPFTFADYEHVWRALDGEFGKTLVGELETRGVKVLGWWDYGFVQAVGNSVRPIRRPEDMKGLRIRSFSPFATVSLQAMGASAPVISANEVYLALQSGTMDGLLTSIQSVHHRKLTEVLKYTTIVPLAYETNPLLVNEATWKKLTPAQQVIVRKAIRDVMPANREAARKDDVTSLDAVKAARMDVYTVPAGDLKLWRDAARAPALRAYLEKAGTLGEALVRAAEKAE